MKKLFAHLPGRLFLGVMLAGSAAITATSLAYFDFGTLPPFAVEKLPVRFEALWLASLRIHVAAALVTFPLCLALTTRMLRRRLALHRWLGRITGSLVLFALVPSGVVLAFDAKGGSVVTAGFLLSAAIVAWFMTSGVAAARRGDVLRHERGMRHVVAQMSVAVTSRAMLMAFDAGGVDPDFAYVVALWAPVLASAFVVEWLSPRSRSMSRPAAAPVSARSTEDSVRSSAVSSIQLVERHRRELSKPHPLGSLFGLRLRARCLARVGRVGR